jgi:hypothetical protein
MCSSTLKGSSVVATQSVRRATRSKSVGALRIKVEVIDMPETIGRGDPLYLFLCHPEWRRTGNVAAYQELLAVLADTDPNLCVVAEVLLQDSPRPEPTSTVAEAW